MKIQETKRCERKLKEILENFKPLYEVIAQDTNGNAEGLVVLQNLAEEIFEEWVSLPKILSRKFQHIGSRMWVLVTGVYKPNIPGEKGAFHHNLTKMRNLYPDDLWVIGGDFNMMSPSLAEKKGEM